MNYRGDITLGDTIDVKFTTVSTAGVPTTLAGSPVVSAYVGNGTTEITAGITLTVDFDARTGMHNVRVVASSGNGFAAATNVDLVITVGTVGGASVVGYVIGGFSIQNRTENVSKWAGTTVTTSDIAIKTTLAKTTHVTGFNDISTANVATELTTYGALKPTVATRTLDVTTGGEAGIDWANIGAPTTTVNLSGTTIGVLTANSDKSGYSLTADIRIKKNTALANFTFLMIDTSGNAATGLTITAARSLDGAALTAMANSASEISNGLYKINLAAADTNADFCCYRFTATGAQDRIVAFPTQTE